MTRLVIDLAKVPEKGDILYFDGKNLSCISKDKFLEMQNVEIKNLKSEISALKSDIANIKVAVNEQFKDIHDILQVLTKEE